MGLCCAREKEYISEDRIEEFISRIRPLDLIVFRGSGVSKLITTLEKHKTGNGDISHVGIAINRQWCDLIKSDSDEMFVWESTMSAPLDGNTYNVETGKMKFGVQLRSLRELIPDYLSSGNVGWCELIENPIDGDAELVRKKINEAYELYNGTDYNANPLALLGALFPAMRPLRNASLELVGKKNKWLFCSEFVATVYIHLGVITDSTDGIEDGNILDPADIVPVDFTGYDADDGIVMPICRQPLWIS
jgi:hypothetical protein